MRFSSYVVSIGSFVLALSGCSGPSDGPLASSAAGNGDNATPSIEGTLMRHPMKHGFEQLDGGATTPAEDGGSTTTTQDAGSTTTTTKKQSLVWLWFDYANSLQAIVANASSFTHVSPAFYQMNYDYTSGVPQFWNQTGDNFDGLTSTQICQQVHAANMKCEPLLFAGGGNGGTDQGIHNVITDTPAGTQNAFITAMVNEGVAKGYDGYNLDWEVDGNQTQYAQYATSLESFLATFKNALHAHNMRLSFDLGTWYLKQTNCSGGNGVVDLTAIASNVDLAILEAYGSALGTKSTSCPSSLPNPASCTGDFMSQIDLMCVYVPNASISIGYNANPSSGSNAIAGDAVAVTQAFGVQNVAIWPDWNGDGTNGSYLFMDSKNVQPPSATWYSLLANFLSTP